MKKKAVRIMVDILAPLYRKVKEQAGTRGSAIREQVLAVVEGLLLHCRRQKSKRVQLPVIISDGPKVSLTSEQIYEYVEFP